MNENPYESPKNPDPQRPPEKRPRGWTAAAVLLLLVSVPAAFIACFTTCAVTLRMDDPATVPLVLGAIAGIAVFGASIYGVVRLVRG